jgi:tetratricopeptide (TPR) repeat protein
MKNKFIIIVIVCLIVLLLFFQRRPNLLKTINDIRQKSVPELDSFNKKIASQNRYYDSIQFLISSGRLMGANDIVNQLLKKNPKNEYYHVLKGQIFDAKGLYDSAIFEFDVALQINSIPIALDNRAKTNIKLRNFQDAITDYKKAFDQNYDYSLNLAKIYDMINQKDSAIKYYSIFIEHYPDSNIAKRIYYLRK